MRFHGAMLRSGARAGALSAVASFGLVAAGLVPAADASTYVGYYASIYAGNGHAGTPTPGPASATPINAYAIAVDSSGNAYVAALQTGADVVERITPAGTMSIFAGTGQLGTPTAGPATATPVAAVGITVDSSGDVYTADHDGYIEKITPDGTLSILTSAIKEPLAVAVDSDDNVYVADRAGYIEKVTPAGIVTVVAGNGSTGVPVNGPATSSPMYPVGVALDSAGNIYEADAYNYLAKISPGGDLSVIGGNGGSGYPTPPTPGPATASSGVGRFVAIDPAGNIFTGGGTYVTEIDPSGTLSVLSGADALQQPSSTPAPANDTWFQATGIALDSSGNIYAADGDVIELTRHYADPPGAPGTPAPKTTNGSVSLSWSAPADDGGSPVTHYYVRRSADGGTTWSTPTYAQSNRAYPAGLTNGTAYQFEVAASNIVGTGAWSAPSTPVTPEPPMMTTVPANWVTSAMSPSKTTLGATGGTGGYSWALTSAPAGLTLSASGVLSANFNPTVACWNQPCTMPYTYAVTDSVGDTYSNSAYVTVDPGPVYFRTAHTLPSTALGAPYEQIIKVGRGWGNDAFTVVGGSLPPHISLAGYLGKQYAIVTGRATEKGRFAVKIRAIDYHGNSIYSWFYITVT